MDEGVSDKKNEMRENNDERKEAECLYDRYNNRNEKYDEKNIYYETTDAESTTMDDGRGVNNKKGGKDVDLDEFDECTCSGDTYYDIYDNEE